MRVGANWPYDRDTSREDTWTVLAALKPDSIVIPSHAAYADYDSLLTDWPHLEYSIRAKTGPGHLGTYPSDILDYKEWENERSLRDALETLKDDGKTLRVIMGNEPDIEMAREDVNDKNNRDQAIAAYVAWWFEEAPKIREAFPDVQLCPAPLSQGNRDRFLQWAAGLNSVYLDADYLGCHCYIPIGGEPAAWGEQYKWFKAMYPQKALAIYETNDNGQSGGLADKWRAARYATYIEQVAHASVVDEVDLFTLPGGQGDAGAPAWWFLTPEMAAIAGAANRMSLNWPAPEIIVDPIDPQPVEAVTMTRDQARRRALADVWNGEPSKAPYNPESALGAFWDTHYKDMGSACGPEWPADDGSVWQGFALGLWVATPGDPWTVEQAA